MKEILEILSAYERAKQAGKLCALATVVHVDGSSYRRPGARMLITEDAEFTGSISGGCLEGDAYRKAMLAIRASEGKLVTYDTSDDDDAKFGLSLGCEGVIQVLIEPLQTEKGKSVLEILRKATATRQHAALITLFSLANKADFHHGTFVAVAASGETFGNLDFLSENLLAEAENVLETKKSSFIKYVHNEEEFVAFTEIIQPPVSIVIAGAGNDCLPLVAMSDMLGWNSLVLDGRPLYAQAERFPLPSCRVMHVKPELALQDLEIDDRTVFVLLTHNYNYDLAMLKALSNHEVKYIGVLGPKKKLSKMLQELAAEGIIFTPSQLASIHGPTGLNIGAESAAEIALSILAEICAVLNQAFPESLHGKTSEIHDRQRLVIEDIKLTQNATKR